MNYLREDTVDPIGHQLSSLWWGTIAVGANRMDDMVYVVLPDGSPNHQVGPCYWQARDSFSMPKRGEKCLFSFDNRQQPWVVAWWPDQPILTDKVHNVNASGEPSLQNGWLIYGAGYTPPGFWRDNQNMVYVWGLINKTTAVTPGETMFVLPSTHRPSTEHIFTTSGFNGTSYYNSRIDVQPNGVLSAIEVKGGSNTFFSLDGISFKIGT